MIQIKKQWMKKLDLKTKMEMIGWNAGQKAIVGASDPVDDKSREDSIKGELE